MNVGSWNLRRRLALARRQGQPGRALGVLVFWVSAVGLLLMLVWR